MVVSDTFHYGSRLPFYDAEMLWLHEVLDQAAKFW